MDLQLEEFLKSRDTSEETIAYFTNENIDCSTFLMISEDEMKKWIPKLGDRVAIKSFCNKKESSQTKQSLLEKLRTKIASKKPVNSNKDSKRNYKKSTRFIEIGWLCMDKIKNRYRQVRAKCGGGTRRISMDKESTWSNIFEKAKQIFFPDGQSSKGPASKFDLELLDYKNHKFDVNLTIQEMYETTGLTILRFYLASTPKEGLDINEAGDDEYIPCTATSEDIPIIGRETSTIRHASLNSSGKYNISDDENICSTAYDSSKNMESELSGSFNVGINSLTDFFSNFNDDIEVQANINDTNSPITQNFVMDENKVLIFHRGKVFEELIEALENDSTINTFMNMKIEMILPNGQMENAEDMGGVLRDALSEFWGTFYEKCTVGTVMKIPYLRHDFGENKWTIIGKIIAMGYKSQKYFPIKIAFSFIESCLDSYPTEENLLKDFFKYISESDCELINKALQNIDEVDYDDILEVFQTYDAKWIPTKSNIRQLVRY